MPGRLRVPGVEPHAHLLGGVCRASAFRASDRGAGGHHPDETGQADPLPREATLRAGGAGRHTGKVAGYIGSVLPLDDAIELTRTGDLWIFRGRTVADRVIQTMTNAPVNHVGMALVLDDLPPLMWHAELGASLVDVWTGGHHRGVQLHDLRDAVTRWQQTYRQRAWLRQLEPEAGRAQEDGALRAVARLDGVSFPSTARLAWRWLRARDGHLSRKAAREKAMRPEAAYCAEVVALTLEEMGLLEPGVPTNWFDPGKFWSGDDLPLRHGWTYTAEVPVAPAGAADPG